MMTIKGKKILILGLGREGRAALHFLRSTYPDTALTVSDDQPLEKLAPELQDLVHTDDQVTFQDAWRDHSEEFDLIIKSAGISPFEEPLASLPTERISSPTQLFFSHATGTTIGVTGTKGKSTTTAAIHHCLHEAGLDARLGGNIGTPMLELLENATDETIFVLELSSHQLWNLQQSPQIAVIQPIVPEHLDYYPTFHDYLFAKVTITANQQPDDICLYNTNSAQADLITNSTQAQLIPFGLEPNGVNAAYIDTDALWYLGEKIVDTRELQVVGQHNWQNLLPAVIIARQVYDIDADTLATALSSFVPLPHRLEKVAEIDGVTYINDSLATTVESSQQAMQAFNDRPLIMMVGGYDRHQDNQALAASLLAAPVKQVLAFPTTGADIIAQLRSQDPDHPISISAKEVSSMAEAVELAESVAEPGDVVLLSPAAASFSLFKDYADRGQQFRTAVESLQD